MTATNPDSSFTFFSQGALIQEFRVAGHNIVQNFPEAKFYSTHNDAYLGETIGRTTNRVKGAKLENLNGQSYQLAANDGENPNSLHGGARGWGKQDFEGPKPVNRNGKEGVQFRYVSKDGEEGYPGTVECLVWYTAGVEDGKTVLEVEYQVEFIGDECDETVVGVTNHSYFHVNPGATTTEGTVVTLGTNKYLELDAHQIPTGQITTFPSVPPAGKAFILGATEPAIDDCFVIDTDAPSSCPLDTRMQLLRHVATISHPDSGLHLEIQSTEPAFQFYTGDGLYIPEVETDKGVKVLVRGKRSGIAIEPSRYVDCAGREAWRGMCRLKRGQIWGAKSMYRAWKE
ncbi:MAG: hypothetical protein LQ350_001258 [Teloschistes chrysophthalmus]|nr:MAG: hypothetical protein LQ350_001258 [Niorma chrysophthalma]